MDDSTFFIIGANGQLGTALRQQYPRARFADRIELDIADPTSVQNFDWSGITTILNAAAYTNVDGAETAEGRVASWQINAGAVANLAAICRQKDITLVHISSDYVFDGTIEGPHTEDEPFSPLSVYGQSKAAGDLLAATVPKHYILRATWVIGEGKTLLASCLVWLKNTSSQLLLQTRSVALPLRANWCVPLITCFVATLPTAPIMSPTTAHW